MESTGEAEAVSAYDEIDIKEEPISTEPELQPFEQIFIKEENIECLLEDETTSPHDATDMKKESVLQNDVDTTIYGSEPESGDLLLSILRHRRLPSSEFARVGASNIVLTWYKCVTGTIGPAEVPCGKRRKLCGLS
ncbi:uncharacterized protein LOC126291570 isoform X5 [Schistocerca gregaria]|uniref:uncharacterized protein LOC126291570 isoform X5 n=1 Tax=Schistocerca gregaria TaxID=7010 RepID=UPI00211EBDD6|nr:uncharacterized protein LOC126291570 isoform X5 [Schistocerca gregaria]